MEGGMSYPFLIEATLGAAGRRQIAKDIGTTKDAVQARRSRMLRVKVKELRPKTVGDRVDSSWDTKLFEPYADRKARMARERQECSTR
jgi:hypothetical protein